MILDFISLFVGLLLVFLFPIIANKDKFRRKTNNYFLFIIALAGLQRIIHGLINFDILTDSNSRLNSFVFFGIFLPPIFFIFCSNLLNQPTTTKKEITLFSISALLMISIFAFNLDRVTSQLLFHIYSTVFMSLIIDIYYRTFKLKKNIKDFAQLKKIKNWSLLIFIFIVAIYLLSNYIFYVNDGGSKKLNLTKFYNLSSFIWLGIILYLLKNPINLYGEEVLLKKLNRSSLNDIKVWDTSLKLLPDSIDIDIEKKVNPNLEKILFDIKAFENDLFEDFKKIPSLRELSVILGYPQSHLKYVFKYYNSYSYNEYLNVLRIIYSMQLIKKGFLQIHTIDALSKKCLFNSRITFYNNFKKLVGYSVTDYNIMITSKIS